MDTQLGHLLNQAPTRANLERQTHRSIGLTMPREGPYQMTTATTRKKADQHRTVVDGQG
jgi:hypothetical protein